MLPTLTEFDATYSTGLADAIARSNERICTSLELRISYMSSSREFGMSISSYHEHDDPFLCNLQYF